MRMVAVAERTLLCLARFFIGGQFGDEYRYRMEPLLFLKAEEALRIQNEFGTPVYVYDEATLESAAREVLSFPNAFGLTARYAIKALPTLAIIRVLSDVGLHVDASSGFEAERALRAGVAPEHIQLTAQELPGNFEDLVRRGVLFNACSVHQLRMYGESFPGSAVCVRVNPGLGSGHSNRTNVGGPSSSFGIWHEHLEEVFAVQKKCDLRITRMHSHIGSGGDPEVWETCARMSLEIAAKFPEVQRLNLGGGFKVGRMPDEESANLQAIGAAIQADFQAFYEEHGRKLHLEIEPGTFFVANAGVVITSVMDVVDTGTEGYHFIKVDGGMTEVLRPSYYGAQQPMTLVPQDGEGRGAEREYVVVGHCCESGDILTPAPGDPEGLGPRVFPEARIGDALVIGASGAYCSAMSAKNYNSFPQAREVLIAMDGSVRVIRERQTLDQMLANDML